MEDTTKFNIPDFEVSPEGDQPASITEKKTPNKKEKVPNKLPRMNRTVNCIHCSAARILNPDQYESYYSYWGDEDKILRNFVCQPCDSLRKDNPFKFWLMYSPLVLKTIRSLRTTFELYKSSSRSAEDQNSLYVMTNNILGQGNLYCGTDFPSNCSLITENFLPVGVRLKKFPFVQEEIEFRPYDDVKVKIIQ